MRFKENRAEQKQTFSIKKYSFGAASVLIGASLLMASGGFARADEQLAQANTPSQVSDLQTDDSSQSAESQAPQATTASTESQTVVAMPSESQVVSDSQLASDTVSASQVSSESQAAVSNLQSEVASRVQTSNQTPAAPVIRRSVATTVAQPAAPKETVTVSEAANGFSLQYNGTIAANEKIKFAVWTEKGGQNDLVWYDASATGAAFVDFSKHREYGKYNMHTYSSINGRMIGRDAKVYDLKTPSVSASFKQTGINRYQVTLSNVPDSITNVSLPTWSEKDGQDDIKWVTATKGANHTYTANLETPEVGHYNVHVYGKSSVTGGTIGLLATPGFDNTGKAPESTTTKPSESSQPAQQNNKPQVSPQVSTQLTDNGIALQVTQGVTGDLSKVRFAVWSDKGGQDDLKWYNADAKGAATALYQNHKDYGTYNVHTYLSTDKGMVGLNATTLKLASPSVTTEIKKVSDTSYDVLITKVPAYISGISVPVWSDLNGQDDLKWVTATKTANGSFKATINLSDHQFAQGHYSVHIYGTSKVGANQFEGIATTSGFTVAASQVVNAEPSVAVTDHDAKKGTLRVEITQAAKAIKKVRVAAWSQANQGNLHWYEAVPTNGKVALTVDQRLHKSLKGDYTVHAYIDFADGSTSGRDLGHYALQAEKQGAASKGNYDVFNKVVYLDAGHGGYDPGASYFGRAEKNMTLSIQNLVKNKLQAAGYTVVTTRDTDQFVGLIERSAQANASDSDIFVSIHINAAGSSSANGIETYYYQYYPEYPSSINKTYHNNATRLSMSNNLAQKIQANLVANTGAKNNGVMRNTFSVLRETTAPAVLLELGYISNPTESQRLATADYQEKLANAIVKGIMEYYSSYGV